MGLGEGERIKESGVGQCGGRGGGRQGGVWFCESWVGEAGIGRAGLGCVLVGSG